MIPPGPMGINSLDKGIDSGPQTLYEGPVPGTANEQNGLLEQIRRSRTFGGFPGFFGMYIAYYSMGAWDRQTPVPKEFAKPAGNGDPHHRVFPARTPCSD